ncbi:MAG TPA: hypothetical protein VK766_02125 [Cytophagaceae bacterium]|jgi:hypothetical protein|nr:hypothetical protein [Cytophagaceae bacterium]
MKKVILVSILSLFVFSGSVMADADSLFPKKKTSLEKRMKKQNKKKKRKGDTTCPKIDC